MKKIFRLSAIVAMLSMMATTATVTSCSDDDDDTDSTEVPAPDKWADATKSIAVEKGKSYIAKQDGKEYTFTVASVAEGVVTLDFEGGKSVTLSDAGESYCTTSLEAVKQAVAKENPKSILLALKAGSSNVISGTEVKDATIAEGAVTTLFIKK